MIKPRIHELRTVQPYFDQVVTGKKTAEIRFNDRNFGDGDYLLLREFHVPTKHYSGRAVCVKVTDVLSESEYLKEGYVMLSFLFLG